MSDWHEEARKRSEGCTEPSCPAHGEQNRDIFERARLADAQEREAAQ